MSFEFVGLVLLLVVCFGGLAFCVDLLLFGVVCCCCVCGCLPL